MIRQLSFWLVVCVIDLQVRLPVPWWNKNSRRWFLKSRNRRRWKEQTPIVWLHLYHTGDTKYTQSTKGKYQNTTNKLQSYAVWLFTLMALCLFVFVCVFPESWALTPVSPPSFWSRLRHSLLLRAQKGRRYAEQVKHLPSTVTLIQKQGQK